ncbi:MAG TPA: hypothetical protein VI483_00160 [Candidatus Paceibacterota bacterium]
MKFSMAIVSIIVLVVGAGVLLVLSEDTTAPNVASISNFDECKKAGYPIMEKYPEECATPDGRTFMNESQLVPGSQKPTGGNTTTDPIVAKQVVEKAPAQPSPQSGSTSWKTYRNDKLGLAFNYPAEWGEATVESGNETSIEVPPCEGPMMETYIGKPYPWGLYNASVKFSKAPIDFEIKLLDLDTPGIQKVVCSGEGGSVTLSDIQPQAQSGEVLVTNKAGIRFVFDPSLFSSINTGLEGPIYTTRHNNKLVWIYSGYTPYAYTPEEKELGEKYIAPCGTDVYNTEKGCGLVAWVQTGVTAGKVRQSFNDLKELVQTFVFVQ